MEQNERLNYLVNAFLAESKEYQRPEEELGTEQKRALLRALMNVRLPKPMDPEVLRIQDEYLLKRNRERGIHPYSEIPTIAEEGSRHPYGERISLWQGDITTLACDAIVNAANNEMLGCFVPLHSCIDNCIHTYAGVQLREECDAKMKHLRMRYGNTYVQPVGLPLLTDGYNLPAAHVIHVAGPIVCGRLREKEKKQLADCYRNVLDLCRENGIRSVAFCCISTGVFHFPNEAAAEIVVNTVTEWLREHPEGMERVIFNVFKEEDREFYQKQLF